MTSHHERERRRWGLLAGSLLTAFATLVGVTALAAPSGAATATKPTVVSLTFDDSNADQLPAEQTMKSKGMVGTFYTVDSWVGQPGYLTRADLSQINADGNEIAGHTVTHPDLIQIDPAEVQRQICNDRATLQSWGYKPVDFAYPFSDANATVESLAKGCGYNTARGLGDVRSPASCPRCVYGESMPPADPFYLKAPDQVDSTWTLAQMEAEVTNAVNHGGGWVVLTFHHICATVNTTACPSDQSTTTSIFNSFINWLSSYSKTASNKTTVKTVDQTVRQYLGAKYPAYVNATSVAPRPPAAVGVNALSNPSLETANAFTGFPSCYQAGGYGNNTPTWASTAGHTGTVGEQLTVANYADGDAKLLPTLDLGTCSPTVVPGKSYNLSVWYKSTGTTQFALYYRDATGAWFYWTSSPWFATAADWTQATFTTPAVPANAVGMTFGFALISNGTLVTDDYSLVDPGTTTGAATAPKAKSLLPAVKSRVQSLLGKVKQKASHEHQLIPGGQKLHKGQRLLLPEFRLIGKG